MPVTGSEVESIAYKAAKDIVSSHAESCAWKHTAKQVDEIHHVLLGNGEPEKGLATQFASLKSNFRLLWIVFIVAIPTLGGLALAIMQAVKK